MSVVLADTSGYNRVAVTTVFFADTGYNTATRDTSGYNLYIRATCIRCKRGITFNAYVDVMIGNERHPTGFRTSLDVVGANCSEQSERSAHTAPNYSDHVLEESLSVMSV